MSMWKMWKIRTLVIQVFLQICIVQNFKNLRNKWIDKAYRQFTKKYYIAWKFQAIITFKLEKIEMLSIIEVEVNLPGAYKNKVYSKFQKLL